MKLLISLLFLVSMIARGEGCLSKLLGFGSEEAAPYKVLTKYEGFEEREYPARKWVSTTIEGSSKDSNSLFWTLYAYISGENDKKASIAMTVPVTTLEQLSPSGNRYTMAFYVPSAYQEEVPKGGPDVTVEDRPQLTVFTKQFGWWITEATVARERKELEALIRAAGLGEEVDFDSYYVAGYDDPFKIFNRRNEIWFVRK